MRQVDQGTLGEYVMKQKVVIRAVVKDRQGRVLLLRRHGGRPSIAGKLELPGGKMIAGEQPEDALVRTLKYHIGSLPETKQLFDVVSYVDFDDTKTSYLFVVYLVALPVSTKIVLDDGYDKYLWKKVSDIQQNDVTNSTSVLLEINSFKRRGGNRERFIIYTDGASRGNPGMAAAGYIIFDNSGDVVIEGGQLLGVRDSNYAEFAGVYLALAKARELRLGKVELRSDSLSVVNQINGFNKIVDTEAMPIYERIQQLKKEFQAVKIVHVRRNFNQMADSLVNKILDEAR